MSNLLERLRAATGADRELDAAIMLLFYRRGFQKLGVFDTGLGRYVKSRVWKDRATGKWVSTHPLAFTSSLDAALALVERVLPGWRRSVTEFQQDKWEGEICDQDGDIERYGVAPTAPLAMLIALLCALSDGASSASNAGGDAVPGTTKKTPPGITNG